MVCLLLVTAVVGYGNAMTSLGPLLQLTLLGGLILFNPELIPECMWAREGESLHSPSKQRFPDQSFAVISLCSRQKTKLP